MSSKNYERWLDDAADANENRNSAQAQMVIFLASISRSLAIIADGIGAK